MASWALLHAPWIAAGRSRFRFDIVAKTLFQSKNHFSASFQLAQDTPAMEALKKHPYPSAALEPSVFEAMSDEYAAAALKSPEHGDARIPRTSTETLAYLVRSRRYSAADRVRAELLEMGVDIQLDAVYEDIAIAALTRRYQAEDQTISFAHWFMLLPEAHAVKPRSFSQIRRLLFSGHDTPNLSLIMQFGLICASKGYANKVASQVISFVVRFADPAVSARFLDEFEKAATTYLRRFYPKEITKMVKDFHGVAIRTHALAGRLDDAVKMMQAARARNLRVSRFTSQLLLQKLNQNCDTKNFNLVRELSPYYERSRDIDPTSKVAEPSASRTDWLESPNLASQLRILKRSLISSRPPTAQALVDFMGAYIIAGRHRALLMLRKKAFRHNYLSLSLWIMAEMLYHFQRREHEMVVVAFHRHFHLVGVPEKDVLRQLMVSAQRRERMAERPELPSNVISPQYPIPEKVWPSSYHTALVWNALVMLSTETRHLEQLYTQLLEFAKLSQDQRMPTPTPPSLSPMPPPIQSIDEAHFMPFIKAFGQLVGPDRAIRAVNDMVELGIQVNIYHYTALAGAFARDGAVAKAMAILDRLEVGAKAAALPAPTIATYTNVLRGFVRAGRIDAALEMEERLVGRAGYVSGSNPKTEHALLLLRALQREAVVTRASPSVHVDRWIDG